MYNNHTPHRYDIALKKVKKEDLPRGKWMTDEEFQNAKVDVTVSQMDINCGFV
jgi:selenocysteine-specific translation elongation factor